MYGFETILRLFIEDVKTLNEVCVILAIQNHTILVIMCHINNNDRVSVWHKHNQEWSTVLISWNCSAGLS